MSRLVSLSRAARLVGVTRGALQKRIHDGDLQSFEGMVRLADLTEVYPNARFEDNSMLEKIDRIIEHAAHKARNRSVLPPDADTLAKRLNLLSEELTEARREIGIYSLIFDKLNSRLNQISERVTETGEIRGLHSWLLNELEALQEAKAQHHELDATDTFLRIMAAQVHLKPSDNEFFVEGSNSILESGLSAGLALNYGCSNGNCGKCKARLISGEIKQIRHHDYVIPEAEKIQGYLLMCSNTAVTDVVLEADEAGSENDIPAQQINARTRKTEAVNEDMRIVHIKTPRTQRLRFLAGQRLTLEIPAVGEEELPIASCPCDDMNLQFHVRRDQANPFNAFVFNELKTNDVINLKGPTGHFVLKEDSTKPIVFIAFGSGFAPIKSLIEHAMTLGVAEFLHLYWVASDKDGLYQHNLCRAWADALESFYYTPLIVDVEGADSGSQAVLSRLLADYPDVQNKSFYVAGTQTSVEQTEGQLRDAGVASKSICTEILG
jgi:CDP-4-dehydro-6-deoxyglucose reductase